MKAARRSSSKVIISKLENLESLLKKKDERPLNFKEACAYLGFAPSYLYKLTYRKVIPHYKPTGKVLFFSKCELDEWIFEKRDERGKKKEVVESEEDEEPEADPSTSLRVTNKGNGTRMTLIKRINTD
jgi:excisionase family DNA binding protein